jgi:hypothetical protein
VKFPNGSRLFFPDQERNKKVPSHLLPVGLGVVNHESLGGRVTAVGTNEDFEMRQRYRRFHSDGSEAMVYKSNDRWEVQLVIPQGASCPSVVARVTSTLDEAKRAADLAVEHHCNHKCGGWVLSIPGEEKQLRLWDRLRGHV